MISKLALVFALTILSGSAAAQTKDLWSGNAMLPACKREVAGNEGKLVPIDTQSVMDMGTCIGLFAGILYYGGWMDQTHKFCAPDSVTPDQAIRVAIKYLDDHPEFMHLDLRASALVAMTKAFPCKR
jgi:hypothetical protein